MYIVPNDVIVLARPMWGQGKCKSGGVVIQINGIKKIVSLTQRRFRVYRFDLEEIPS